MTKPLVTSFLFACALTLIAVGLAVAWNEPTGFREHSFGMSQDEVDSLLRVGGPGSSGFDQYSCTSNRDYNLEGRSCDGGVKPVVSARSDGQIYGRYRFYFSDAGRLISVIIGFEGRHFDHVEGVFLKAYGKPTRVTAPTYTNRLGAQYTGRTISWSGQRVAITLERYGIDLDHSAIQVQDIRQTLDEAGRRERREQDAANELLRGSKTHR